MRNLERGSPISAEVALRRFGKACELLAIDLDKMVNRVKRKSQRIPRLFGGFGH